mgnify:CR=1 FL=1
MSDGYATDLAKQNLRRLIAGCALLAGCAEHAWCAVVHSCACGHLMHVIAPTEGLITDTVGAILTAIAVVMVYRSNMRARLLVMIPGAALLLGRLWPSAGCMLLPAGAVAIVGALVCFRRPRKVVFEGLCLVCDYDLTGNVSGRCPECGTQVGVDSPSAAASGSSRAP